MQEKPQPPARRRRSDPREGGAGKRFGRGFNYLFDGWSFVGQHKSLLKFCIAPLVINLAVFCGVAVLLYLYYGDLVALIWARPESWLLRVLWYTFYVVIFVAIILAAYVAFFVVQAVLSAPFNDLLSERTEILAFGREPPPFSLARLLSDLVKTMLHETAKLAIWLAVMVPLFLLNLFVPVVGTLIYAVGGFLLTARFFAYDFLDYSMARREWSFSRKWSLLQEQRALALGFGSALELALMVPVFGLICVPMAAVGGTLMFCDLEQAGAFAEPGGSSASKRGAPPEPPGQPS